MHFIVKCQLQLFNYLLAYILYFQFGYKLYLLFLLVLLRHGYDLCLVFPSVGLLPGLGYYQGWVIARVGLWLVLGYGLWLVFVVMARVKTAVLTRLP